MTDSRGFVTSYSYDERGNLSSTSYADGTSESVAYDAENNKISETDKLGRQATMTYVDGAVSTTVYDPSGRVTSTIDANGNTSSTTYDDAGQVLT